ncbi:MAG: alpha/beta fold hydrolase [Acidimicrobiales bacterium]
MTSFGPTTADGHRSFGRRARSWIAPVAASVAVVALAAGCSSTTTTTTQHRATAPRKPSIVTAPIRVAHTSDGTVSYRSLGRGPTVLLIMGYSGSMDQWQPAFVDALATTHRVVIFDNAGIGQTSTPPGVLSMSSMADQTAALITALHLGRPAVLGWSMGGMIAQALAVLRPGDVGHLVLAATLPGNGHATLPSASAAAALANPAAANAGALLGLLFPPNHAPDGPAYLKAIEQYPHLYLAPPSVDAAQLQAITSWAAGQDQAGRDISRLRMPVLVADGSQDALIPAANDHEMAHVIPHAQLVLYPDASHAFLFQDETTFVARLDRFFA